ncbi:glycosyl transferase-like protein [Mollisia scopiformis]|uniref:Glycosyl transferas-like protein n=1 Tax=Mollisia scopiformis TaxID=149040 RepID=A0A132B5C8_MOLSC|nr:glycosyl transferase-like protein [Mollisia scopiformis]KUJ07189.1 glycosyl transferas-like protein [Mollisia scopiformis]
MISSTQRSTQPAKTHLDMMTTIPASTYLIVSAAFQDAGDTTRAIALALALREYCPKGHDLKIDFLSCGSRFEPIIQNAGFNVVPCQPRVPGLSVADDLEWDFPEFIGSEALAKNFIEGQLEALRRLKPDVVLHGMWPATSLAARLLGIRTISFLPLPLHPASFSNGLIRDLPDMIPLFTRLPRPARQWLAWHLSHLMVYAPIFRQHRIGAAAAACGWPIKGPLSLFDMAKADLNLVNDLPEFHADYSYRLPEDVVITGPLFARIHDTKELDQDIAAHLHNDHGPSILVTMGSSGTKDMVFEAIRALILDRHDNWKAVVLAAPAICSIEEARAVANDDPRLLVTDRFIPAPEATPLADVVIMHGGQGTVQTAIAAGTPVVGVALQVEQQTNLDNVMNAGAGIRIQRRSWHPQAIRAAVKTVLADPTYKVRAMELAETIRKTDGARTAAECMWRFLLKDE